jgi:hypothetical protein
MAEMLFQSLNLCLIFLLQPMQGGLLSPFSMALNTKSIAYSRPKKKKKKSQHRVDYMTDTMLGQLDLGFLRDYPDVSVHMGNVWVRQAYLMAETEKGARSRRFML